MAYPNSGLLKIYPTSCSIIQGTNLFSLNNEVAPQATKSAANLQAYYDLRVANSNNAPCMARTVEIPAASTVYVPSVGVRELQFYPDQNSIEFYDGAYPGPVVATEDFLSTDFPSAMIISSVLLYIGGRVYIGEARDRSVLNNLTFKYNGATVSNYTGFTNNATNNFLLPSANQIPTPIITRWSILKVLLNTFGFSMTCSAVVSGNLSIPLAAFSECFILATYETNRWSFSTTTPMISAGGVADLLDANNHLTDFNEFKIYWVEEGSTVENIEDMDGGVIITDDLILELTSGIFRFIVPTSVPKGGKKLILTGVGTGTFFVGEFPIQNYNTQLVDGSGLYKLVDDQPYDTYYDRSTTPVTTTDLKIPDPYVKTGFFNA